MKCSRNITIAESFFALQGIFINTCAGLGGKYHFVVIGCALRMTERKKILHPLRRNEREAALLPKLNEKKNPRRLNIFNRCGVVLIVTVVTGATSGFIIYLNTTWRNVQLKERRYHV